MWRDIETAPRDGTDILVARNNGCSWDYAVVWWTGEWWNAADNAYTSDRFDYWAPIKPPHGID